MYKFYSLLCTCTCISPGGKILRPSEINTNIATWSRLLSRAAPAITAGADLASPMGGASGAKSSGNLKPVTLNFDSDTSPPQSDSQSGENSPKTPDTPSSYRHQSHTSVFDKDDDGSVAPETNGPLPPPSPVSDAELMHTPDQIIIPPPPQFVEDKTTPTKGGASGERRLSNGVVEPLRPPSPLPELVRMMYMYMYMYVGYMYIHVHIHVHMHVHVYVHALNSLCQIHV